MEEKIVNVVNEMAEFLNISQLKKLQEVLIKQFTENEVKKKTIPNEEYLRRFIEAKIIEGCTERTVAFYKSTAEHFLDYIELPIRKISTENVREYLADYQLLNGCGNVTIDNIRRNISSLP